MPDHHELTEQQKLILDFETQRPAWQEAGARDGAIHAELGVSPTRYAQILNALLDHPPAAAYAPQTIHRLRDQRQAQR